MYDHFYLKFKAEKDIPDFIFNNKPVASIMEVYLDYSLYYKSVEHVSTSITIPESSKIFKKLPMDLTSNIYEMNYAKTNRHNIEENLQNKNHYRIKLHEDKQVLIDKMNDLLKENFVKFYGNDFKETLNILNERCPLQSINYTDNSYSKEKDKLQVKVSYDINKKEFRTFVEERTEMEIDDYKIDVWYSKTENPARFKTIVTYESIYMDKKEDFIKHRDFLKSHRREYPDEATYDKIYNMVEQVKETFNNLENKDNFIEALRNLPDNPLASKIVKNNERYTLKAEKMKNNQMEKILTFYNELNFKGDKLENQELDKNDNLNKADINDSKIESNEEDVPFDNDYIDNYDDGSDIDYGDSDYSDDYE
jgi:hypothetical protein